MGGNSFIIACCHPEGESREYDGLFFRDCEFESLADQLKGKPLLFNHESSMPLGTVVSAWAGEGESQKREVFALCEIDDSSMGCLAKRGIDQEVLQDVSIGHRCKIEQSAAGMRVTTKSPVELSICEKGARENTHIYGVSWAPVRKAPTYIKVTASASEQQQKMSQISTTPETPAATATAPVPAASAASEDTPTVESAAEGTPAEVTPAAPAATKVNLTHNVLTQFKKLQEKNSQLEADLSAFRENGRKLRESEMNGGVRAYMEELIAQNPELAAHKAELEALMSKMVESDSAGPLVKLMRCAASKSSSSVTELEKQYQAQKDATAQIEKLSAELDALKSDAFALPEDRVVSAYASSSSSNKRSRSEPPVRDIFSEIGDSLKRSSGNGVPTFSAAEFHMKTRPGLGEFL